MSSKKKGGRRSITLVREAVRKCGCDAKAFFVRAAQLGRVSGHPSPVELSQKFCAVEEAGNAVGVPFIVPEYVLRLADEVVNHRGDPRPHFGF